MISTHDHAYNQPRDCRLLASLRSNLELLVHYVNVMLPRGLRDALNFDGRRREIFERQKLQLGEEFLCVTSSSSARSFLLSIFKTGEDLS